MSNVEKVRVHLKFESAHSYDSALHLMRIAGFPSMAHLAQHAVERELNHIAELLKKEVEAKQLREQLPPVEQDPNAKGVEL